MARSPDDSVPPRPLPLGRGASAPTADRADGAPAPGGVALSRRELLLGLLAGSALLRCGASASAGDGGELGGGTRCPGDGAVRDLRAPSAVPADVTDLPAGLFTLGVASGDPSDDGVVLWTRLAPAAGSGALPDSPIPVRWELARDEAFTEPLGDGVAVALPEHAHSVHVEVAGLAGAATYWYRFRVGAELSPVGRTRTLPCGAEPASSVRFALASCQSWQAGYYAAHRHLAAESLDLVFFVGDYIYEGGPSSSAVRRHDGPECRTLDDYRRRYAQYKGDADLQAAHAAHPWVVTWDDHEVDNDYSGLEGGDDDGPTDAFRARRAAAYQAWWEHQPVRLPPPVADAEFPIHRSFELGGLGTFFVLDTRQYRDPPACAKGLGPVCPERDRAERTFLGAAQRDWLLAGLTAAPGPWRVAVQSVVFATLDFMNAVFNPDQWDGYTAERQRVLDAVSAHTPPGFVVLSGDIHVAGVARLMARADDLTTRVVGTELVTTSISSGGDDDPTGGLAEPLSRLVNIDYLNARQRGYLRCEVTAERWLAEFRALPTVLDPAASIDTVARFEFTPAEPSPRKL